MNEELYTIYINEHINNVKYIWKKVEKSLKIYDQSKILTINNLIETHDKSKFNDNEFKGYCQYFYPTEDYEKREKCFQYSWNVHQKKNPHHWEYWIIYENGKNVVLDMDYIYIVEMLCDWSAMSMKFKDLPLEFYNKNKDKMLLHKDTKSCIERLLPKFNSIIKDYNYSKYIGI